MTASRESMARAGRLVPEVPQHIIIAAMTPAGVIGRGDGMPWHVPEEYAHFLACVRGRTMVMGRRSWAIFGGDVQTAHNVVVSRRVRSLPGAAVAGSLGEALALADGFGLDVFIAGGASIYRTALEADLVDAMYLSTIHEEHAGDTHFPAFDPSRWEVAERTEHARYTFVHYRRSASRDAVPGAAARPR
jgi:dihydrofolate reductase